MTLPLLNTAPKYELTVPSTKQVVRFRPFLVKEQKVLLLAYETQDKKQVIHAILDTVAACVVDDINVYSLTTFDIDYMFTQIRGKSVGEKVELVINCEECEAPNDIDVDLEQINIEVEESTKVIQLTDEVSVKLKYPNYSTLLGNDKFFTSESTSEIMMEVIMACIDSIMTEEENIKIKDEPREEIEKFVESMSSTQFAMIAEFVQTLPAMEHTIDFNCISCGAANNRVLKGLDDFF